MCMPAGCMPHVWCRLPAARAMQAAGGALAARPGKRTASRLRLTSKLEGEAGQAVLVAVVPLKLRPQRRHLHNRRMARVWGWQVFWRHTATAARCTASVTSQAVAGCSSSTNKVQQRTNAGSTHHRVASPTLAHCMPYRKQASIVSNPPMRSGLTSSSLNSCLRRKEAKPSWPCAWMSEWVGGWSKRVPSIGYTVQQDKRAKPSWPCGVGRVGGLQ